VNGLAPVAVLHQILAATTRGGSDQGLAEGKLCKFRTLSHVLAATDQELLGFDGVTPEGVKLLRLVAAADKLVGAITDELLAFLRSHLQEADFVHEMVSLRILIQVGMIEEDRVEEFLSRPNSLLRAAIKDAKTKHRSSKRVRVVFNLDEPPPSE
jgi:hypothetical protein